MQTLVLPNASLIFDNLSATSRKTSDKLVQADIAKVEGALKIACLPSINLALDSRYNPSI